MNLTFTKCVDDREQIDEIFQILKLCGEDMYFRKGLSHWKTPYGLEKIEIDCREKEVYLVFDKDVDEFVSTFMLSQKPSSFFEDNSRSVYISKFATKPKYSGKGLGGRCLEFIEQYAKDNKLDSLRLDVYDKSEEAVRFYTNKGFKVLYSRKTVHFEVYCMEKKLGAKAQ